MLRDVREEVLCVVEQDQRALAREVRPHRVAELLAVLLSNGHSLGDRGQDRRAVAERCERHPHDAVRERLGGLGRRMHGEPRLPGSAGAGEGQEADVLRSEEVRDLGELGVSTDEGVRRDREVRLVQALQTRELLLPELVNALRRGEILEAMLAEVAQVGVQELRRRGRDEDLPAVAAGCDAGGAVDVLADVSLLAQERRPGMQADPDPDRTRRERLRESGRRRDRSRCGREREEERVALRIDLDPAFGGSTPL